MTVTFRVKVHRCYREWDKTATGIGSGDALGAAGNGPSAIHRAITDQLEEIEEVRSPT